MKSFLSTLVSVLAIGLIQCGSGPAPTDESDLVQTASAKVPLAAIASGDWETLASGYGYSDAPAVDRDGNVYYSEHIQNRIYKMTPAGEISLFDENTARTMGLMFAPDGRLVGCRNYDAQIVAYDMQGGREVLLQGELSFDTKQRGSKAEFCNGLVVSSTGDIWFNDRINRQVIYLDTAGRHRVVASGFRANGIILSPDEKILVTTDSNAPKLWAFDVQADGSLQEKPDFFDPVQIGSAPKNFPNKAGRPGTNGMTVDSAGRYYVTSFRGIQVFGANGKFLGVIASPSTFVSDVTFAGKVGNYLYATGVGGLYRIPIDNAAPTHMLNSD